MIEDKHKYIRVLRIALGLSEPELYRKLGGNWKTWRTYHIDRLEQLVFDRQTKIFNAVGEDDFGVCEAMENLVRAIRESHEMPQDELKRYLRNKGQTYSLKVVQDLCLKFGFSEVDVHQAAKEIGVVKVKVTQEQGMSTRGKPLKPQTVTHWKLPANEN